MGHVGDETVLGIAARDNSGHLAPFQFTRRYYSTKFVCCPSLSGHLLLCFWPLLCHAIVIFFVIILGLLTHLTTCKPVCRVYFSEMYFNFVLQTDWTRRCKV